MFARWWSTGLALSVRKYSCATHARSVRCSIFHPCTLGMGVHARQCGCGVTHVRSSQIMRFVHLRVYVCEVDNVEKHVIAPDGR